jgi:hypothetical protein
LAGEFGGGASENEKGGRISGPVGQYAQNRKEPWFPLGFVEDHQSAEPFQNGFGIFHESGDQWVFEVKIIGMIGREELACEGGFAGLPGAEESDDRVPGEGAPQRVLVG